MDEVRDVRVTPRAITSLERPVGEDGSLLGDLLPSADHGPDAEVEIGLAGDAVRGAIARLAEREREVIELRVGLESGEPTAPREAGKRLGL